MNIKTAEALSGVSRQNIRFYEREGLLTPDRNPENDYREYQQSHIETLKRIRIMRMLDMPLDQIKLVLEGKLTPAEAAKEQKKKLGNGGNCRLWRQWILTGCCSRWRHLRMPRASSRNGRRITAMWFWQSGKRCSPLFPRSL